MRMKATLNNLRLYGNVEFNDLKRKLQFFTKINRCGRTGTAFRNDYYIFRNSRGKIKHVFVEGQTEKVKTGRVSKKHFMEQLAIARKLNS